MTDIGILFSPPMVRALLDGRKSQTRRVLKPGQRPAMILDGEGVLLDPSFSPPVYCIGDRLWVRERLERANGEAVGYPADGSWLPNTPWLWQRNSLPSIHCPRRLSRLTLTVTDVRVERLKDISEGDAVAEGIEARGAGPMWGWIDYLETNPNLTRHYADPRRSYATLWEVINGPGAWDANPWVVAISFTVERRNIDAVKSA